MTLEEMDKKVLAMIEELNPKSALLTDDPDIAGKIRYVTNQKMFELVRMKKLPKYLEKKVCAGDVVEFADLAKDCGYEIYQINQVTGVNHTRKGDGTILKFLEDGTAEIDVYVYPEQITETTNGKSYEFELTQDVLEIMPYGIAADLLMSDASAQYGSVYAKQYELMLSRLDPRHQMTSIYIEGGVNV